MRDEDNKEPFAAQRGLQKPPVPPLPGVGSPSTCPGSTWACGSIWGDTCQSHSCLWGAHMASADSSPAQGSLGGLVMKGINAGTQEKKTLFCCEENTCERYCLLLWTVFFWKRFAFSRHKWSEVVKSALSCKAPNLAQPDPSWGKTAPRFGNTEGVHNNTMLK